MIPADEVGIRLFIRNKRKASLWAFWQGGLGLWPALRLADPIGSSPGSISPSLALPAERLLGRWRCRRFAQHRLQMAPARDTRLLIVPTAQPQMAAASSYLKPSAPTERESLALLRRQLLESTAEIVELEARLLGRRGRMHSSISAANLLSGRNSDGLRRNSLK